MSVCCACVLRLLCVSRESVFLSCVVLSGCGLVVRFGGDNIYIGLKVSTRISNAHRRGSSPIPPSSSFEEKLVFGGC